MKEEFELNSMKWSLFNFVWHCFFSDRSPHGKTCLSPFGYIKTTLNFYDITCMNVEMISNDNLIKAFPTQLLSLLFNWGQLFDYAFFSVYIEVFQNSFFVIFQVHVRSVLCKKCHLFHIVIFCFGTVWYSNWLCVFSNSKIIENVQNSLKK